MALCSLSLNLEADLQIQLINEHTETLSFFFLKGTYILNLKHGERLKDIGGGGL